MDWYVLFVRTSREDKVKQLLKERLNTDIFVPFVPVHENLFKISGVIKKELKPLFPGYVFIKSEAPGHEFIKKISAFIHAFPDIVRILRYSDTEIAMRESEKNLLMNLYNDNHCIESSSGIIVGNKIHITDGPLKGWESIVRKINRHKRQALIEIEFMGAIRLISVALEVVEKIQ